MTAFVLCVHACVCMCVRVCVCAQTLDVFLTWFVCLRNQPLSGLQSHSPDQQVHLDQSPPGKQIKCNSDKSEEVNIGMYNVAGPAPCQTCAGPLCCNHVQHDWKERKANDSKCIQKQGDHWFVAGHCQPCFIYASNLELLISPHSILPHGDTDTPGTSNERDRVRLLRMAGGSVIHLP